MDHREYYREITPWLQRFYDWLADRLPNGLVMACWVKYGVERELKKKLGHKE